MSISILSIGDELLDGRVLNTNAHYFGSKFSNLGFAVSSVTVLPDSKDILVAYLRGVTESVCIVTGGLGPTEDDCTREVMAEFFGARLVEDSTLVAHINSFYSKRGQTAPESNGRQSFVPEFATVIPNDIGTAFGFWKEHEGAVFVCLPGVPSEMKPMFESSIQPMIEKWAGTGGRQIIRELIKTYGISESGMADLLKALYPLPEGVRVAYQVKLPEIHVQVEVLTGIDDSTAVLARIVDDIHNRLSAFVFGKNEDSYFGQFLDFMRKRTLTIGVAESCTGGLIGAHLTSIPGSSDTYAGGVIAYDNSVKERVLGVRADVLASDGAVSASVAIGMAKGVKERLGSDIGVSVTGIAGPASTDGSKPVGAVVIGVSGKNVTTCRSYQFFGDRNRIRMRSVYEALRLVREALSDGTLY